MEKLALDQVDILLIDPDRAVRSTIRNILIDNGFRNVTMGSGLADIESKFQINMPDLLISDIKLGDGSLSDFVYKLRHHDVGSNPFLPIIATAWSPTSDDVRSVVQSGADDIVAKPLSAGQLLQRIMMLIKARKPFVVTSAYIGPDRRKPGEDAERGEHIEQIMVPNVLKAKATADGRLNVAQIQREIDACSKKVNLQKLDRHAHQALWLVDRIVPGLAYGSPDEATSRSLERLLYVAEDTGRRMVGTPFAHVDELCKSLIEVTGRILNAGDFPSPKDVALLQPLAKAIQRGFDESDSETVQVARKISESVSTKH
ncbi:MAG: response regulator [Rhodospirillales bacterium]|nr:response regulator [Rhodospirillales bacterium]